ncbi:MAG: hypothetical protein WD749_03005 [Phycisphaerales bacterium]
MTINDLTFEAEAASVLGELHSALAGVVDRLRPPVGRPTDLHRLLKLDHRLSWSVFNAATAQDARALASLLPGRRAMERFFLAAAAHGVPAETVDGARGAFERFERSIARHARSRDAFEVMVAGIGGAAPPEDDSGAEAKHKRAMFRAASLLWGRQARVFFGSVVVSPGPSTPALGLLDCLLVKGMIGLHQTRHDVPLTTVARHVYAPSKGDPSEPMPLEAIDPGESAPDAVGLLRDFCSQPTPTFRIKAHEERFTTHELVPSGIGASSEVTYFTGHVGHGGAAMSSSVPGSQLSLTKIVEMPIEVYIGDILMHESLWDERLPAVKVYVSPVVGSTVEFHDSDLLPFAERAMYLGRGPSSGRTPLVPRYVEMMSYAMERVGWNPEEFRVFRCHVDHPVLSTRIRMTFRH